MCLYVTVYVLTLACVPICCVIVTNFRSFSRCQLTFVLISLLSKATQRWLLVPAVNIRHKMSQMRVARARLKMSLRPKRMRMELKMMTKRRKRRQMMKMAAVLA